MKGLLTNHILFDLFGHLEYRFVRETVVYLMTPGDPFFKLSAALSEAVLSYVEACGLNQFLCSLMESLDDLQVFEQKKRSMNDSKLKEEINAIVEKISHDGVANKKQNLFQRLFNNFILGKLAKFTITNPEEIHIGLPNIDGLPQSVYSKMSKKKASIFGLSADMMKLSQKLFDLEHHPGSMADLEKVLDDSKISTAGHSQLKRMNTLATDKHTSGSSQGRSSILKKSLTKVLDVLPFTKKFKRQALTEADRNEVPGTIFLERIATYSIKVLDMVRVFNENLEFNLKKERFLTCIIECLHSIITSPIQQAENKGMAEIISQTKKELDPIKQLFFSNLDLYTAVFKVFLLRLEYKILNGVDLQSVAVAGKLILSVLNY